MTALLETVHRLDPASLMGAAGLNADAWQARVLRSTAARGLWCAGRQCGKSVAAAALALKTALYDGPALVLLLSPSLRQSGELFRDKVLPLWRALGEPQALCAPTQLALHLHNGSRIISLPGEEGTVRGYSGVKLLVIDEAARVPDSLYFAVRPMLAVSRGRLVALSTPFGKRGWFYSEWSGTGDFERVSIAADQCPRIDTEFLAQERAALGKRWFDQEYACVFGDAEGSVFDEAEVLAMLSDDVRPLDLGGR